MVNNTTASARQLAKCILFHTYTRTTGAPSCASTKKINIIAYLIS